MNYGKLPPQARDIEDAVLGALMIDRTIVHSIVPTLSEYIFYDDRNRLVFKAIAELVSEHEPIDILTVTEKLKEQGQLESVGGPYYLTELTGRIGTSNNVEYHTRIIIEKWLKREIIMINTLMIDRAYDDTEDVFDMLNEASSQIIELLNFIKVGSIQSVGKLVQEVYANALSAKNNPKKLIGIPSGFIELDRMTNGWKEPDLIIVAARPGMGKTAFVLNMARNAANQSIPIGIFSLEMSSHQLTQRLLSMESGVETGNIEKGRFEVNQLDSHVSKIGKLPIYMNDKAAITPTEIMTNARKMVVEYGVKMIAIDYIQLVKDNSERGANREQQVSNITRSLKMIAKDMKLPVIALSQLSRNVEQRSDKRPVLSDLRESGAIEQDADMVVFLYRPEYYGTIQNEIGESTIGKCEVIIAKHRSGGLGTINLEWDEKRTKFSNGETYTQFPQRREREFEPDETPF